MKIEIDPLVERSIRYKLEHAGIDLARIEETWRAYSTGRPIAADRMVTMIEGYRAFIMLHNIFKVGHSLESGMLRALTEDAAEVGPQSAGRSML